MTAGAPTDAKRTTILIVEDDPGTANLLGDIFKDAGYGTIRAHTGHEAQAHVRGQTDTMPDLVLLDLILPDMDGLVLCATIRSYLAR